MASYNFAAPSERSRLSPACRRTSSKPVRSVVHSLPCANAAQPVVTASGEPWRFGAFFMYRKAVCQIGMMKMQK